MFDIRNLTRDPNKEINGTWMTIAGGQFKVARMNNTRYQDAYRRITKPHQRTIQLGEAKAELLEDLMARAASQTILLDWKDVKEVVNGVEQDVPYSHDKAYEYFKKSRDFFNLVIAYASDGAMFNVDAEEAVTGNL